MKSFFYSKANYTANDDSRESCKLKLIYRGNTFDYIPRPVVSAEE
ncbi:hypothetical protein [Aliterella atlantica]|nr:hypothetical protein [Aliterella atlantica]